MRAVAHNVRDLSRDYYQDFYSSFHRSSLMLNTTDSEVNSVSSEDVLVALPEYESLPPRPGTVMLPVSRMLEAYFYTILNQIHNSCVCVGI